MEQSNVLKHCVALTLTLRFGDPMTKQNMNIAFAFWMISFYSFWTAFTVAVHAFGDRAIDTGMGDPTQALVQLAVGLLGIVSGIKYYKRPRIGVLEVIAIIGIPIVAGIIIPFAIKLIYYNVLVVIDLVAGS